MADPPAYRRKGISFPDHLGGFSILSFGDGGDVFRDANSHRTGMMAGGNHQGFADCSGTAFIPNMGFIFIPKIFNGGKDRFGTSLPQPAKGGIADRMADFDEQVDVFFLTFPLGNAGKDFKHLRGSQAAGAAFPAGFGLSKTEEEAGNFHHAVILIHDHHAARTHDRPDGL